MSDLHADAAAISDSSPAIKKFAQDVANILQPVAPPPPPPAGAYFAADSPWNTPIGPNPVVVPQSAQWVANVSAATGGRLYVNSAVWTPLIFSVKVGRDAGWGYHDVYGWNRTHKLSGVPLNAAMPNPKAWGNTDNAVYIIDESTGLVYCVGHTPGSQTNGDWDCAAGGSLSAFHLTGSGWWDQFNSGVLTAAGGGSCDLGGMILIRELKAGRIPHALKCAMPNGAHRGPDDIAQIHHSRTVLPATRSDGSAADNASTPPYGSHYQLDPSLDVTTLSGGDKDVATVLRCLQEFGMYDTDSNGAGNPVGLYAQCKRAEQPGYPFRPGTPNDGTSSAFDRVLNGVVQHLRIVQPPASVKLETPTTIGKSRWTAV